MGILDDPLAGAGPGRLEVFRLDDPKGAQAVPMQPCWPCCPSYCRCLPTEARPPAAAAGMRIPRVASVTSSPDDGRPARWRWRLGRHSRPGARWGRGFGWRTGRPAAAVRERRSRRPGPVLGEPRTEPAAGSGRTRPSLRCRRARGDRPPGRALRTRHDGRSRPNCCPRSSIGRHPKARFPTRTSWPEPCRTCCGGSAGDCKGRLKRAARDARAQPPANTPSGW